MADLRRLDFLRRRSMELRKLGIRGISQKYESPRPHWDVPGDYVEKALLLHALRQVPEALRALRSTRIKLESCKLADFFHCRDFLNPALDRVPVLRAAVILEALAAQPGAALTLGALGAYFRIIYSLYATKPEELLGGARAGHADVPQTAFVTWRCVRSVLLFAGAFDATATLVDRLAALRAQHPSNIPESWTRVDRQFRALWVEVEVAKLREKLLLQLSPNQQFADDAESIIAKLRRTLRAGASVRLASKETIKKELQQGADTAFGFAFEKCQSALIDLQRRFRAASTGGDWAKLAEALRGISQAVNRPLAPAASYLRSVLDHELVSGVMQPQRVPDAAEMIFAAAGLALLDPKDNTPYQAALGKVVRLMTDTGRVPSHRPFDVATKGYVVHVAGVEVFRAFAELAYAVDYNVDVETAQRILTYFSENWREEGGGWRHERDQTGACSWWLSALAVDALESYTRMLDRRINQIIFADLSVRQPKSLKLQLDTLFYPDFGLVAAGIRQESVATALVQMFAHVSNVRFASREDLHSAVLYGPPGTGKTSLVEAIASSAGVPLVEVTPSDILLGGEEKIETRARVVFEALAMLSEVVINFDEFDRVLWDRGQAGNSDTIFQFLTPGMLPKLKKLHDEAREQRTVFVLSTNLIGGLDAAAIREGRFDRKIGIYPPDALSRMGRLLMVWHAMGKSSRPASSRALGKRLERVLSAASGRGMNALGKPGWFTQPARNRPEQGTPLNFLLHPHAPVRWPDPEKDLPASPHQDYQSAGVANAPAEKGRSSFPNPFAEVEWKEWKFVVWFDDLVRQQRTQAVAPIIARAAEAGYGDKLKHLTYDQWQAFLSGESKMLTQVSNAEK